ncbi:UDP-2,3-diacylglucosamine hydrolase [Pseudothermotoga sp. U03pept]|uniref:UDP-2,3-diacylglucosamine hydrolase n=1 Tax=Pseudothermotoga sp. U03pept TaxID=3447012 RepID=UPI003F087169
MKRVFLSDLHIGDGSAKDDFEFDVELSNLINDFAQYQDAEIVIVGDGFELIESRAVKDMGLIPFEDLTKKLDGCVVDAIAKRHPIVFDAFRHFARNHKIFYVVGNHDYYLLSNKSIQERLAELLNVQIVPYYYNPDAGILAIHGNQFDIINKFGYDRKNQSLVPPLGDYIARYMMFYFDEYIQSMAPFEVIRDYDNVRPALDVFHWFERAVEVYDLGVDILELWISTFLQMMRTSEAKFWMKKNFPVMHCFSRLFLNKMGGMSLGSILVRMTMKIRNFRRTDYLYKTAKQLLKGKKKLTTADLLGYSDQTPEIENVNGVIFGHIHHNCLRVIPHDGQNKFYINCGSWRPVVEKVNGKKRYGFQRKAELFYAVIIDNPGSDLEIITSVTNKMNRNKTL